MGDVIQIDDFRKERLRRKLSKNKREEPHQRPDQLQEQKQPSQNQHPDLDPYDPDPA